MDLNQIWHQFIDHLLDNDEITQASIKKFTGIPFIYIHYHPAQNDDGKLSLFNKKSRKPFNAWQAASL